MTKSDIKGHENSRLIFFIIKKYSNIPGVRKIFRIRGPQKCLFLFFANENVPKSNYKMAARYTCDGMKKMSRIFKSRQK